MNYEYKKPELHFAIPHASFVIYNFRLPDPVALGVASGSHAPHGNLLWPASQAVINL
jgi:hypothetical protein